MARKSSAVNSIIVSRFDIVCKNDLVVFVYAVVLRLRILFCQGILLIPALLIFPLFWGIDGVLIAGAVSDGVAGFVALIIGLKQVRWLNKMKEEQKDRA